MRPAGSLKPLGLFVKVSIIFQACLLAVVFRGVQSQGQCCFSKPSRAVLEMLRSSHQPTPERNTAPLTPLPETLPRVPVTLTPSEHVIRPGAAALPAGSGAQTPTSGFWF